jgi:hypothetical protein
MCYREAAVACALLLLGGCARRESPEDTLARSKAAFLRSQIAGLEKTIGQVERGEITTADQVAIGVSEGLAKTLLNASLPLETTIANRLRIRVESAAPGFRSTKAAILFRATVGSVDVPRASATLDIGGGLDEFRLEGGMLRTRVKLAHFAVRESSVGDLGADVIDRLVKSNLDTIEKAIPVLEFPVSIDESLTIGGLSEGPVVARPGRLPLDVAVSQVIVGNRRLWILLKAEAGRWQAGGPPTPEGQGDR